MCEDNKNICYSGGCAGADELFGNCAKEVGHDVIHYVFRGMKTNCKELSYLNDLQLLQADICLKKANKYLKRTFPCKSVYVNNLLRRNYYQIMNVERIYAISSLNSNGYVEGGTGWTVTMGILENVPEVYLFDIKKNHWFTHEVSFSNPICLWYPILIKDIPFPSGNYAGIGKHDLPENGINAIRELYKIK